MYEHEPDQYLLDLQERDKPTLDNFVVGANGEAVSVLREVAAGCGPTFVYLYGPKGAGLTHLLRSLVPEEGFRVPMFDLKVPLYVVDDVDELDPGWALQLLALQNAVRGTPGMHSCVRAGCPPLSFRFPKLSEVVWPGDSAMQFVRLTMRSVLPSFTVRPHDAASSSRLTSFTGWGPTCRATCARSPVCLMRRTASGCRSSVA